MEKPQEQWEWEEDDDDTNLDNGCAVQLVRKEDGYLVLLPNCFAHGPRSSEPAWIEVDREHAQLIAAAPNLLAALQSLVEWSEFMGGFEAKVWEDARELLAKIREGGSNHA